MFTDVMMLAIIMVFIIDLSGVVDSLKNTIKIQGRSIRYLKPFDCSLCMTFWSGVLYLLINGQCTLQGVALVCLAALSTSLISEVLQLAVEVVKCLIRMIYKMIDNV